MDIEAHRFKILKIIFRGKHWVLWYGCPNVRLQLIKHFLDSNFQHSTMDSLLSGLIVSIQKVILHILDFITFASKTFNILELLEGLPLGLTDSIVRGKCTNNNFTIRKNLTWNIVNSELRTQSLNNITIHSKSQMLHARNGTF